MYILGVGKLFLLQTITFLYYILLVYLPNSKYFQGSNVVQTNCLLHSIQSTYEAMVFKTVIQYVLVKMIH